MFLDLFNAFNGKSNFKEWSDPVGKVYIGVFMFIFKIILLALLAGMFINRYKTVFKNIEAHKRFSIIKHKNSISYDRFIGGITITFFPINIILLPFILPIALLRNKKASGFLLKLQYGIMVMLYCMVAGCMIIPAIPLLYIKIIVNS